MHGIANWTQLDFSVTERVDDDGKREFAFSDLVKKIRDELLSQEERETVADGFITERKFIERVFAANFESVGRHSPPQLQQMLTLLDEKTHAVCLSCGLFVKKEGHSVNCPTKRLDGMRVSCISEEQGACSVVDRAGGVVEGGILFCVPGASSAVIDPNVWNQVPSTKRLCSVCECFVNPEGHAGRCVSIKQPLKISIGDPQEVGAIGRAMMTAFFLTTFYRRYPFEKGSTRLADVFTGANARKIVMGEAFADLRAKYALDEKASAKSCAKALEVEFVVNFQMRVEIVQAYLDLDDKVFDGSLKAVLETDILMHMVATGDSGGVAGGFD